MKTIKEINKLFDKEFYYVNGLNNVSIRKEIKSFWNEQILSLIEELEGKLDEMKKDKHIPYQALQFSDCPECGQEVNQKWIDMKTKEIRDEAIDQMRASIKSFLK